MTRPLAVGSNEALLVMLSDAESALHEGRTQQARVLAEAAQAAALARRDRPQEACALHVQALAERALSMFPQARASAQQAALLFAAHEDVSGEIRALTVLAHVNCAMACHEDALEAALLGTALSRTLPETALHADAANSLGLVRLWLGQFDLARQAFDDALAVAQRVAKNAVVPLTRSPGAGATFVPEASNLATSIALRAAGNLCWLGVAQCAAQRDSNGLPAEVGGLPHLLTECDALLERVAALTQPGRALPVRCMAHAVKVFALAWLHRPTEANECLRLARESADAIGPGWMDGLCYLAATEACVADGRWFEGEQQARALIEVASQCGHEQFAATGHLLVALILEHLDKPGEALAELRQLHARQQRVLLSRSENRQRVVGWRLALRDEQQRVRRLQRSSRKLVARHRQLERLSVEDPLTGLLNRRGLEREALPLLANGELLTAALMDVDDFKQINDTHTHLIGDRVLQQLAALVQAHTRAIDVIARMAGDEFVVLFPGTPLSEAVAVCDRLSAAVRDARWADVAQGLRVTVSLGLAERLAGEGLDALMMRSDRRMYEAKRFKPSRLEVTSSR